MIGCHLYDAHNEGLRVELDRIASQRVLRIPSDRQEYSATYQEAQVSPEEVGRSEVEAGHHNHPFAAAEVLHTGDAYVVACSVMGMPDQADVAGA